MREHGHNDPVNNLNLRLVKGSDLDEDVLGVQGDLGVIAVDDRRKRADGSLGVVDHGVNGGVADDVEVLAQVLVFLLHSKHLVYSSRQTPVGPYLVESHQLLAVHFFRLVERDKLDVLRGKGLVCERALDGVQIVGTDGNKGSLPGEILVELVLQGNEGFVTRLVEFDIAENGTGDEGADLHSLRSCISFTHVEPDFRW